MDNLVAQALLHIANELKRKNDIDLAWKIKESGRFTMFLDKYKDIRENIPDYKLDFNYLMDDQ